jgi:anti-sigma factor RsiW
MNCERVKELFADALAEGLDEKTQGELEAHLRCCPSCREESANLQSIWAKLASLPEQNPRPALDDRVRTTLEVYGEEMKQAERQRAQTSQTLSGRLWSLWPKQPSAQFAVSVLLFALGLFLGLGILQSQHRASGAAATDQSAIAQLREEIATMNQLLTLSLMEQPSASERLRGVEWTSRLDQPDAQVLSVLLRVVVLDPNVNVRLAAVEALQKFMKNPRVRKGLIDALAHPQSPSVQIDLIDAMVRANEKDSVTALKALLQNPAIDPIVRERAEWALQRLS